jgi:hypothetical protein
MIIQVARNDVINEKGEIKKEMNCWQAAGPQQRLL